MREREKGERKHKGGNRLTRQRNEREGEATQGGLFEGVSEGGREERERESARARERGSTRPRPLSHLFRSVCTVYGTLGSLLMAQLNAKSNPQTLRRDQRK